MSREPELASKELADLVQRAMDSPQIGQNALKLARDEFERDRLYGRFSEALIEAETG